MFFMRLIPQENCFFDYFEELAGKLEEGGRLFLEMARALDYAEAGVSRLKKIEHEADGIAHKTYEKMHKTFLTPMDREDMYALVNQMDNIVDAIESTAVRIHMYKVKKMDDAIVRQADILFQAVQKIKAIIPGLRSMKNNRMILDGCVEIHTLENAGDVVLRTMMTDLFAKEKDAFELIKWKEIFERIEEAIDGCETVSHIVEGIVLKHT